MGTHSYDSMRRASALVRTLLAFIGLALVLGTQVHCKSDRDAELTLRLTDATPRGIARAIVTIEKITLEGAHGDVVLRDEPFTTDLVALANSTTTLVEQGAVPPGQYQHLRLVVSGGFVEVEGEAGSVIYATHDYPETPSGYAVRELRMPGYDMSGLTVPLPGGDLASREKREVVIDFDVTESFAPEAGTGAWAMRPKVAANKLEDTATIHVEARADRQALAAAVNGAEAWLWDKDNYLEGSVVLLDPDGDGVFAASFDYLDPGEAPFSVTLHGAGGLSLVTSPPEEQGLTAPGGGILKADLLVVAAGD